MKIEYILFQMDQNTLEGGLTKYLEENLQYFPYQNKFRLGKSTVTIAAEFLKSDNKKEKSYWNFHGPDTSDS